MPRAREVLTLAVVCSLAGTAVAQPVDPYLVPRPSPDPMPAPPTPRPRTIEPVDPYLAPVPAAASDELGMPDRIAAALVSRAQQLLELQTYLDAKQLAVEALVQSPQGPSSEQARAIIHTVNVQLGIPEDAPKPEPATEVVATPYDAPPPEPAPEAGLPSGKLAGAVHGGLYAGLLGAMAGSFFSNSTAKGAVPTGLAIGAAGAAVSPWLVDKLGWSEAQVRTVGSAAIWGGAAGGLIADLAKTNGTSAREVLVGAAVGATAIGAAGYALTRNLELTRGDVALIDTFAGVGAAGGLTIGMLMQPAQSEAYSLNAMLGIAGGVVIGLVAAPQTNTTPRRMLRVAGLAAAGGGAPFLLYAGIHDRHSTDDERIVGLLSSVGLLAGVYLGFRWTRDLDDGLDTIDGKRHKDPDDAPLALVSRSSAGRWAIGGLGIQPLSPKLSSQQGMALQIVGASF